MVGIVVIVGAHRLIGVVDSLGMIGSWGGGV